MQSIVKHSKVLKWGNSLGIRLTHEIASLTSLDAGSEVDIVISGTDIIIKKKSVLTEDMLLAGIDSYQAHADEVSKISDQELDY